MGFPCGSAGKESACNVGDLGSIPGLGRSPGEGKRLPTPVFWPGEFHGLYSPWGHKESDTTGVIFTFRLSEGGSDGKESACDVGDPTPIPGSGRAPGEGNEYLLSDQTEGLTFSLSHTH